jgi:hypothetical protein
MYVCTYLKEVGEDGSFFFVKEAKSLSKIFIQLTLGVDQQSFDEIWNET